MVDPKRPSAYGRLYAQLEPLIREKSPTLIAGMATIAALLHAKLKHHSWTGFYFMSGNDELHVGPYQGPVACQVLKGRGVCLAAALKKAAVVVPDVEAFPGHITCDSRSRSEIVLPLMKDGKVLAVLDIDSERLAAFDDDDIQGLEKILGLLEPLLVVPAHRGPRL
jgi:GAF domain-containing protein